VSSKGFGNLVIAIGLTKSGTFANALRRGRAFYLPKPEMVSRLRRAVCRETVAHGSVRGLGVKFPFAYSTCLSEDRLVH
jgi:ActR/RegA family two-component response regulator